MDRQTQKSAIFFFGKLEPEQLPGHLTGKSKSYKSDKPPDHPKVLMMIRCCM